MVARGCTRCRHVNIPEAAFCTGCGQSLREASLPRAGEERRRVSVLFIDAVGSTPFAERADPEAVRTAQSGFFRTVRHFVRQYGGIVEKYIGDAAMALFGAPIATEDDAVRCVRAGLDLQRALAQGKRGDGGERTAWTFRAAVATGEALVDVAAAHDGGQAIVAGDVVNTAARLQAFAPMGGLLVCGETYAATNARIRYQARPPLTLRGRSAPTEVWLAAAALAPVPEPEPPPDAIALIGREHELGLLTAALEHVITERSPRLVTVVGATGMGKSRLVRELYRYAVQLDAWWVTSRCQPFGENVTYSALADIVASRAGITGTDSPQAASDRLDQSVDALVGAHESAKLADPLHWLIKAPWTTKPPDDAEPAWRRFLLAIAEQGPAVLVFEDLHWADERMLRFVELLAASARGLPLLIIATARPPLMDREPAWAATVTGTLTLSLTPLRPEAIAALYGRMFGDTELPAAVLAEMVELADGVPLFAEEYARTLVERGLPGHGIAADDYPAVRDLPMPESIRAVIANRIDLLDSGERAVLQAAAVVGHRFWPSVLAAALATSVELVQPALTTLAQRDLIREQHTAIFPGEPEYRFGHVLVADVCYERLPRAERVSRHLSAADWLDNVVQATGGELADVVAHNRFKAFTTLREMGFDTRHVVAPTLTALCRAARRAAMVNAPDQTAGYVEKARSVVAVAATDTQRFTVELLTLEWDLHRDAAAFLTGAGPDRLAELADLLQQAGDHSGAARAWTLCAAVAWRRCDRPAALACLDRAVELFDGSPDTAEKAATYAELGRLHMLNVEHAPAIGAAQIAVDIADRLDLADLRASALITIGVSKFYGGDLEALAQLRAVAEFCRINELPSLRRASYAVAIVGREEGIDPNLEADTDPLAAVLALTAGDWDAFTTVASAVLAAGNVDDATRIRAIRSWVRALRDDPLGAAEDAHDALLAARSGGLSRPLWGALAHTAFTCAISGDFETADARIAELAKKWTRSRSVASNDWVGVAAHCAALLARADPAAAETLIDALSQNPRHTPWSRAALATLAAALAETRGDWLAAARGHEDAARQYLRLGSFTDRAIALAAATTALSHAGDRTADDALAEVNELATRNRAKVLAALATPFDLFGLARLDPDQGVR